MQDLEYTRLLSTFAYWIWQQACYTLRQPWMHWRLSLPIYIIVIIISYYCTMLTSTWKSGPNSEQALDRH